MCYKCNNSIVKNYILEYIFRLSLKTEQQKKVVQNANITFEKRYL